MRQVETEQLQLSLFDLGPNMEQLREAAQSFKQATRAENTMIAYNLGWKYFIAWCQSTGRSALPATAESVKLYVAARLGDGLKCTSLEQHLAAITFQHRQAGQTVPSMLDARAVLRGAKRVRQENPAQKHAFTPLEIRKACELLIKDGSPLAIRNRAILLLGIATGFRRTNLTHLTMNDLRFVPRRGVEVTLRNSKTDQTGLGKKIGVRRGVRAETCPVRALQAWIAVRGDKPGVLFPSLKSNGQKVLDYLRPVDGEVINLAVKDTAELLGLDPEKFGGHSLRATCVTAAHLYGASTLAIMERTGHKSVAMVQKYLRNGDPFAGPDPLARAL